MNVIVCLRRKKSKLSKEHNNTFKNIIVEIFYISFFIWFQLASLWSSGGLFEEFFRKMYIIAYVFLMASKFISMCSEG